MRNLRRKYRNKRAVLEHLVIPGAGATIGAIATLIQSRKTKASTKEKLKQLIRNAALGAMVGGGLEYARVGISNAIKGQDEKLNNTIADGNFIER